MASKNPIKFIVELVKRLKTDEGVTKNKNYRRGHRKALDVEKKEFPKKDYERLKTLTRKVSSEDRMLGTHRPPDKSGVRKILISREVPARLRSEVIRHEKIESREMYPTRKTVKRESRNRRR